jgi:hypothetical protein
MTAHADLPHDIVRVGQHLVEQRRRQLHAAQVEEDAGGTGDALLAIGHFAAQLDGDAHRFGKHAPGDVEQRGAFHRRGWSWRGRGRGRARRRHRRGGSVGRRRAGGRLVGHRTGRLERPGGAGRAADERTLRVLLDQPAIESQRLLAIVIA